MMQIIDCEQGSPEWFAARMGIPTSSSSPASCITKGRGENGESRARDLYMRKLAGELLTGEPMVSYRTPTWSAGSCRRMKRATSMRLMKGVDPERVGFIRNGNAGCSPDSLIDKNGGLEIKCALPHVQIERIEKDQLPPEHKAQVQGNLWLAEREYWDFTSYSPRLPLFVTRVYRDEKYIADLAKAVDQFNEELAALVARIRSYGAPKPSTLDLLKASAQELERT
jgi:hypothetical protein